MKRCPKCQKTFPDEQRVCPEDGSPLVAEPGQAGGYQVAGRYTLGNLVERRPVGDIYEAADSASGASVWVFVAAPHVVPDAARRDLALRELRVAQGISSETLVRILDSGTLPDGRIFVVTERLDWPTLASRVGTSGPLPVEEAAAVARSLALLLKDFQARNVVHRDLSPSNVFVQGGKAKLLFLGVAPLAKENVFGDPWFMAPEQASGRPADARCNMYSLGGLFYYAVVGAPPYPDSDPQVLLKRHAAGGYRPPTQARPDLKLPPEVDHVVSRAMAVSPVARYFSFDEMALALGKLAGSSAQPAKAASEAAVPPAAAPRAQQQDAAQQAGAGQAGAPPAHAAPAQGAAESQTAGGGGAAGTAQQQEAQVAAGRRRRRKGGFRATLWFMKGEQIVEEAEKELSEDELLKITAGDGQISDAHKDLHERYEDDGSIRPEDRQKYSLRTGRTGMMRAVQVPVGTEPVSTPTTSSAATSRLIWGVITALIFLGLLGAIIAYMMVTRIPESFVGAGLYSGIAEMVPDFEPERPKLTRPSLPDYPAGEAKALWKQLLTAPRTPEKILPAGRPGAGEILVAFARKLERVKSARRRRRKDPFRLVAGRKAKKAAATYAKIRKEIVAALEAKAWAVQGKSYTGRNAKEWQEAYRAAHLLADLPGYPKAKEAKEVLGHIESFFAPSPARPRPRAAANPLAGIQVGAKEVDVIGRLKCLRKERRLAGGRVQVTCAMAGGVIVRLTFEARKGLVSARALQGGKELGRLGSPRPARARSRR